MILAGDLGGTKCTLILFSEDGARLNSVFRFREPTRDFPTPESLMESFLRAGGAGVNRQQIKAAALGSQAQP